jgi:small subunit ribosomal protein S20
VANKHASAMKQQRQDVKRRARNRRNVSQLKTQVKKLRGLVHAGDAEAARAALNETVSAIDRAAKKGVIHDNAAARAKSRLTRHVNAVKAPAAR